MSKELLTQLQEKGHAPKVGEVVTVTGGRGLSNDVHTATVEKVRIVDKGEESIPLYVQADGKSYRGFVHKREWSASRRVDSYASYYISKYDAELHAEIEAEERRRKLLSYIGECLKKASAYELDRVAEILGVVV